MADSTLMRKAIVGALERIRPVRDDRDRLAMPEGYWIDPYDASALADALDAWKLEAEGWTRPTKGRK